MTIPRWILLAALALGMAVGLTLAWVVAPDRGQMTSPHALRADYKDQVREVIAAAYAVTGDLQRARARLDLLRDADSIQALSAQAQRALASGMPFEAAQELARLASDLQAGISSLPSRTPQPVASRAPAASVIPRTLQSITSAPPPVTPAAAESPGPSATSFPTPTAGSSATPIASPSLPFRLTTRDKLCEPHGKPGLLQVTILDSKGSPLPGVELTVTWGQGADRFFTGLQAEISPGYADYTMSGGITYSLQVARLGVPVSGLTPPICSSADDQPYLGGLRLIFTGQ